MRTETSAPRIGNKWCQTPPWANPRGQWGRPFGVAWLGFCRHGVATLNAAKNAIPWFIVSKGPICERLCWLALIQRGDDQRRPCVCVEFTRQAGSRNRERSQRSAGFRSWDRGGARGDDPHPHVFAHSEPTVVAILTGEHLQTTVVAAVASAASLRLSAKDVTNHWSLPA